MNSEEEIKNQIVNEINRIFPGSVNFDLDNIILAEYWDHEEDEVVIETILNTFLIDNKTDFHNIGKQLYQGSRKISEEFIQLFYQVDYSNHPQLHFYPSSFWYLNKFIRLLPQRGNSIIWEYPSIEGGKITLEYNSDQPKSRIRVDRKIIIDSLDFYKYDLILSFFIQYRTKRPSKLILNPSIIGNKSELEIQSEDYSIKIVSSKSRFTKKSEDPYYFMTIEGNKRIRFDNLTYPPITFLVWDGINSKSIVLNDQIQLNRDEFTFQLHFDAGVLDKYKLTSNISYNENGYISRDNYWGSFRGGGQIGLSYFYINLGDFVEGIHRIEWDHWKQHNRQLTNHQIYEFRNISTFKEMISRCQRDRDAINQLLFNKYNSSLYQNKEPDAESFKELKLPISANAQKIVLQDKIALYWTLFVDGIDKKGLQQILQSFDENLLKKNKKEDGGYIIWFGNLLLLFGRLNLHYKRKCNNYESHAVNNLLYDKNFISEKPTCYIPFDDQKEVYDKTEVLFWLAEKRNMGKGHHSKTAEFIYDSTVQRYSVDTDEDSIPMLLKLISDDVCKLLNYCLILFS